MGFLAYIYDPDVQDYLAVEAYCQDHQAVCTGRVNYDVAAE